MEEINQNLLKLYLDAMPRSIFSISNLPIFILVMLSSFMMYYFTHGQSEQYSFTHFITCSIQDIIFMFGKQHRATAPRTNNNVFFNIIFFCIIGYFYYISKRNQYALAFQIIMIRDRIETLRNAIRLVSSVVPLYHDNIVPLYWQRCATAPHILLTFLFSFSLYVVMQRRNVATMA